MTAIPYLSVLKATGEDASAFLHGQFAADVLALSSGQCSFAAYCSARGQVIALLLVCREDDGYMMCVESSLAKAVLDRLRKYIMRAKVHIELQDEITVVGVSPVLPDERPGQVFTPAEFSFAYSFSKASETTADSSNAWREQELRQGVTWLQADSSERFLPQMLGLDAIGAVSFSKGCYPGQEIIARTRYLGKLKRKPVLLEVTGLPGFSIGEACLLESGREAVEAVVVDGIWVNNPEQVRHTLLLLVAPLESEAPVSGLKIGESNWPAERTYPRLAKS